MRKHYVILVVSISIVLSCSNLDAQKVAFEDVTEGVGLIEPLKGIRGHGGAWGDVNNDGYPDLFLGTFASRHDSLYNVRGHQSGPEPDKLLINNQGKSFTEVMDSPTRIKGSNSGATFADFDNDGDLDLVTGHLQWEGNNPIDNFSPKIYENIDGQGNFVDVTPKFVNDIFIACRNTFVFDYDGDGLLDILLQDDAVTFWNNKQRALQEIRPRLLKNMGGFNFNEVNKEAGIPRGLYGLGGFAGDINDDGWPDFYFGHSSRMFINNRDGTFHEKEYEFITPEKTLSYPNSDWICGADIGDLDGDGDMDLVLGNHFEKGGSIWILLNEGNDSAGDPVFKDVSREAGVDSLGKQPHVEIQDFNNDGRMDILIVDQNGLIYVNEGVRDGIPHFTCPQGRSDAGGIYLVACPAADYDRDGKLDLMGAQWIASAHSPLLKNVTDGAGNYIDIRFDLGNKPNRNGIGAKVSIYEAGKSGDPDAILGVNIISVSNGYSSGQEAIAHFGLPGNEKVDILVSMPCSGKIFKADNINRNQVYTIKGE